MATTALTPHEIEQTLLRWQQSGLTESESDALIDDALAQLNNSEKVKTFEENINEIADASMKIDATFSAIDKTFEWLAAFILPIFPELQGFWDQWKDFKNRWRASLRKSSEVAADSIEFLSRFDKVYLDMVEKIETDADRLAAIKALEEFTKEQHDGSVAMSESFLGIKRDIEAFVKAFDQWVVDKGAALGERAKQLKGEIDSLLGEVEELDRKIKDAKLAMAITGGFLFFIGMIIAAGVVASLQSQRRDKANQLANKKAELEAIQNQEKLLGVVKAGLDAWKPGIALICDKLVVFAETWSSVRSQTVQFREHLLGGMGAITNVRFKKEVKLARGLCTPLVEGLKKYKAAIDNPSNWT